MTKLISILTTFLLISLSGYSQLLGLHYSETSGFDHNTRNQSFQMFQQIGPGLSMTFVNDNNGNEFNSLANLKQYKVVIFSNTSGANLLTPAQRANFELYIASGGSYLGIHAASDTYRHSLANGNNTGVWDWYAETVAGCSVQENPNHTNNNHNNTMDFQIPANSTYLFNIPNPWNKTEEYYYWQNGYLNTSFTEILRVGQTGGAPYDAPRMTAHFKNLLGGGVAYYTSLGHAQSNFTSDQNFRQLIINALEVIKTSGALPIFFKPEPKDPQVSETVLHNPITTTSGITFTANVSKFSELTMTILDLSGKTLVSYERKATPSYNVLWKQPAMLAPGTYLVKVSSLRGLVYSGLLIVNPN